MDIKINKEVYNNIIHVYDAEHTNNMSNDAYNSKRYIPKLYRLLIPFSQVK